MYVCGFQEVEVDVISVQIETVVNTPKPPFHVFIINCQVLAVETKKYVYYEIVSYEKYFLRHSQSIMYLFRVQGFFED